MTPEIFKKLSKSAQEQYLIEQEILEGKFGPPNHVFMTTRDLAESRGVSVVTAHNILSGLCEKGLLELRGKKYYLTYPESQEARDSAPRTLGLIIPQLNNEFFSSIADAVIQSAREKGYQVAVVSTSYNASAEEQAFQFLLRSGVSGIINCQRTPEENIHLYTESPVPCISLAHSLDHCSNTSVQVNSFSISQKAAQHLFDEGYRDFIYVSLEGNPLEQDTRYAGYEMCLRQNGYILESDHIFKVSRGPAADNAALEDYLRKADRPVGVFCYHDLIAVQIYHLCNAVHKRIPQDVGIIGFDDLSIASLLTPPLTTVQYRIDSMSEMTLNLLITSIEKPNTPCSNYYVEPSLVVRGSSLLSRTCRSGLNAGSL